MSLRWFPYALRLLLERRPRHARPLRRRLGGSALAVALPMAVFMTLPLWLILMGVI